VARRSVSFADPASAAGAGKTTGVIGSYFDPAGAPPASCRCRPRRTVCRKVSGRRGRPASSEDDPLVLPPIPPQRGTAVAERHRLPSGQPVAAAGAAAVRGPLVVNEPATTIGQDGRPALFSRNRLPSRMTGSEKTTRADTRCPTKELRGAGCALSPERILRSRLVVTPTLSEAIRHWSAETQSANHGPNRGWNTAPTSL